MCRDCRHSMHSLSFLSRSIPNCFVNSFQFRTAFPCWAVCKWQWHCNFSNLTCTGHCPDAWLFIEEYEARQTIEELGQRAKKGSATQLAYCIHSFLFLHCDKTSLDERHWAQGNREGYSVRKGNVPHRQLAHDFHIWRVCFSYKVSNIFNATIQLWAEPNGQLFDLIIKIFRYSHRHSKLRTTLLCLRTTQMVWMIKITHKTLEQNATWNNCSQHPEALK